jgi:uncharacterized coiled-coil protein SlyX
MDPDLLPLAIGDSAPPGHPLSESTSSAEARRSISNLRDAVADLERRVEQQATLLRALYSLLSERWGLTDAALLARFQEIDSSRGERNPTVLCVACGRPIDLRHNRCLYCGATRQITSPFELL